MHIYLHVCKVKKESSRVIGLLIKYMLDLLLLYYRFDTEDDFWLVQPNI